MNGFDLREGTDIWPPPFRSRQCPRHADANPLVPLFRTRQALRKVPMSLSTLINDFADALAAVDATGRAHKTFRPGIGPFGEADATKLALEVMKQRAPNTYREAITKRQPDVLIPGQWQIEIKVVRPFGDNGKEAENWSQNLLHPYTGNTSSLGDCLKLLQSERLEPRAILVFGYEHDPPRIQLEPCIRGFEILASSLMRIRLSERQEQTRKPLIHPEHQVLRVFGWQVLSMDGN